MNQAETQRNDQTRDREMFSRNHWQERGWHDQEQGQGQEEETPMFNGNHFEERG